MVVLKSFMESVDILDSHGQPTGQVKTRAAAHRDGDWHAIAHVWVMNRAGDVLLQHRGPDVEFAPNLWDVSVGGHVGAGETPEQGARRELQEEISLPAQSKDLRLLFQYTNEDLRLTGFWHRAIFHVFRCQFDGDPTLFKLQTEEVAELKFFPIAEFQQLLREQPARFVPRREEYHLLFEILKQPDDSR